MKKLLPLLFSSVLILSSCRNTTLQTSSVVSDENSLYVSEITSADNSDELSVSSTVSEAKLPVKAKDAVTAIIAELKMSDKTVEIDEKFLSDNTGIDKSMYDDFFGLSAYEIEDTGLVAVFGCKLDENSAKIRELLGNALNDGEPLSYLKDDAKIISSGGYTVFIVTDKNVDEINITSKLIQ